MKYPKIKIKKFVFFLKDMKKWKLFLYFTQKFIEECLPQRQTLNLLSQQVTVQFILKMFGMS